MTTNVDVAPLFRENVTRSMTGDNADLHRLAWSNLEKYLELLRPMHFTYYHTIDNAAAVAPAYAAYATQNVMKATHDCSMIVTVGGTWGDATGALSAIGYITDGSNNNIMLGSLLALNTFVAAEWKSKCWIGIQHYSVGQQLSYKLWYGVSGGNIDIRSQVHVQVVPRQDSAIIQ